MILRALFWIALVSVLMPHEPDLGFGRPHLGVSLPSQIGDMAREAVASPQTACDAHSPACLAGVALLSSFQSVTVRSLAEVKADIEQSAREDAVRHGAI